LERKFLPKDISGIRVNRPSPRFWLFFEKIRGTINPFAFSLLKKKALWYGKPPKNFVAFSEISWGGVNSNCADGQFAKDRVKLELENLKT
jgi:hypothetical protein